MNRERRDVAAAGGHNANKAFYDDPAVADGFARRTALFPSEEFVLAYLADRLRDASVVDIGVGAGRTTPYLTRSCGRYVGLDYSEEMLKRARALYPGVDLRHGDATDMAMFADRSVDVVCLGFNMIDDADPPDRLRILTEIHRILKDDGVMFFSAHNLDGWGHAGQPVSAPGVEPPAPAAPARDHVVVREVLSGHAVPTYFITRENQIRQLAALGFGRVETVDESGRLLDRAQSSTDRWLYYIAFKLGPSAGASDTG
jgi:SAM-dependent methyltransferase